MASVIDRPAEPLPSSRVRVLAPGLLALGAGLVALALLGPLVGGPVDYRISATLRNQTIGLDAVGLMLVAPLCVAAAVWTVRGRVLGPVLALSLGSYTTYMMLQYVLGPDYAHLPGNNERVFALASALSAGGWMLALLAWNAVGPLPAPGGRARWVARVGLPAAALLAFSRYLPALADWMSSAPEDPGYLAGPGFAWAIALLDLGVWAPLTVAACVGLARGAAWAPKAVYAVAGWFGLVGPAVSAMAVAMYVNDDPTASLGDVVFLSALGLVFAALAIVLFRPLRRA